VARAGRHRGRRRLAVGRRRMGRRRGGPGSRRGLHRWHRMRYGPRDRARRAPEGTHEHADGGHELGGARGRAGERRVLRATSRRVALGPRERARAPSRRRSQPQRQHVALPVVVVPLAVDAMPPDNMRRSASGALASDSVLIVPAVRPAQNHGSPPADEVTEVFAQYSHFSRPPRSESRTRAPPAVRGLAHPNGMTHAMARIHRLRTQDACPRPTLASSVRDSPDSSGA
jgi:hypothetical protein